MTETVDKIEELTAARQRAWSQADGAEAARITEELDNLYSKMREQRAEAKHGDRKTITRQARIALELEKVGLTG